MLRKLMDTEPGEPRVVAREVLIAIGSLAINYYTASNSSLRYILSSYDS